MHQQLLRHRQPRFNSHEWGQLNAAVRGQAEEVDEEAKSGGLGEGRGGEDDVAGDAANTGSSGGAATTSANSGKPKIRATKREEKLEKRKKDWNSILLRYC